ETLHQSLWPEELVRGFTTFQKLFEELGLDGDVHAVSVPWSYPRSVKLHKFSDTPFGMTVPSVHVDFNHDSPQGTYHWVHITGPGNESYVYLDALGQRAFRLDRADKAAGDGAD